MQKKTKKIFRIALAVIALASLIGYKYLFYNPNVLLYPIPIETSNNVWVFIMPDLSRQKSEYHDINLYGDCFYRCCNQSKKYGILNTKLEKITEFKFDKIKYLNNSLFIGFTKDSAYLIDASKLNTYYYSKSLNNSSEYWRNGLIIIGNSPNMGVIDSLGNVVLDAKYDQIIYKYNYRFKPYIFEKAIVRWNGKESYLNLNGKLLSHLKYDLCLPFCKGRAIVLIGNKWGMIDTLGNEWTKPVFDQLSILGSISPPNFQDKNFNIFRKDIGYFPFIKEFRESPSNSIYAIYKGIGVSIDSKGRIIHDRNLKSNLEFPEIKTMGNCSHLIDSMGKQISEKYEIINDISDGILKSIPYFIIGKRNINNQNKFQYGVLDIQGKVIFKTIFDEVGLIDEDLVVLRDNKSTMLFSISGQKTFTIGSKYTILQKIYKMNNKNYLIINNNNVYSIINGENGRIIQDNIFKEPIFYNQVIQIFKNKKNQLIDFSGNLIWSE